MEILDRDIYDPLRAKTPEQTSWTMRLLERLDASLGPSAVDKPLLAQSAPAPTVPSEMASLQELARGEFDDLFPRTTIPLSDLYRQTLHPVLPLAVQVLVSEPMPSASSVPPYPPIARVAHVSGKVHFTAEIGADGHLVAIHLEGHPLLTNSVQAAVATWMYPKTDVGTAASGTIEFRNSCPSPGRP